MIWKDVCFRCLVDDNKGDWRYWDGRIKNSPPGDLDHVHVEQRLRTLNLILSLSKFSDSRRWFCAHQFPLPFSLPPTSILLHPLTEMSYHLGVQTCVHGKKPNQEVDNDDIDDGGMYKGQGGSFGKERGV